MSWFAIKALFSKAWANITLLALAAAGVMVFILRWMLGRAKEREEALKKKADEANYRAAGAEAHVAQKERADEAVKEVRKEAAMKLPPDTKKRKELEADWND